VQSLPGTQHPYVYGLNNPVRYTDPSGEVAVAALLGAVAVGAVIGGTVGGIGYLLQSPGQPGGECVRNADLWRAVVIGAVSGAVAGAVGWAIPSLLPTASSFWGAVGIGALTGALASGAGQVTVNLLTPCASWYSGLGLALTVGAITGGLAGGIGYGVRLWLTNRAIPTPSPRAPILEDTTNRVLREEIIASGHTRILDDFIGWPVGGPKSACQVCAIQAGINPEFFGQPRALLEIPGIPHVVLGIVDDAGSVMIIDNSISLGNALGHKAPLNQYMQNVAASGLTSSNPVIQVWSDFSTYLRYVFN